MQTPADNALTFDYCYFLVQLLLNNGNEYNIPDKTTTCNQIPCPFQIEIAPASCAGILPSGLVSLLL